MAFYEWSESMSVGVELIDSDHKALIDLINRLHDMLTGDAGAAGKPGAAGGPSPEEVFDTLIAYTEIHFAREEKVMQACGFPATASHQDEHADFTTRVYDIRDKVLAGDASPLTQELLDYLKDWLNAHILIQDMAYKPYAAGRPDVTGLARSFGPGLSEQKADQGQ